MRRGVKKSTAVALVGIMSAAMLAGGCAKKNDNKKDDEKTFALCNQCSRNQSKHGM